MKKAPVSPSLTSIFSSLTHSSSGSNSTVTQESVRWGKHSSSKQGVVKRPAGQHRRSNKKETSRKSPAEEKKPDVFDYIEHDDEEDDVVGDLPSESEVGSVHDFQIPDVFPESHLPAAPLPPVSSTGLPPFSEDFERSLPARPLSFASLHSDSGISIRSSSSERSSTGMQQKLPKKPLTVRSGPMVRGGSSSSAASSSSNPRPVHNQWDGTPESFYSQGAKAPGSQASNNTKQSIKAVSRRADGGKTLQEAKAADTSIDVEHGDKGGYDFVASQVSTTSEDGPRPLYRRFEALNNRILLMMQDEIMTMENDLSIMDQRIAETEGLGPTSRRAELQSPTPLQRQRMKVQAELVTKLGFYNRALASYNALAQLMPTSDDEVQEYKDFLEENNPLVASETAFLEHLADLSTITGVACSQTMADKSAFNAGVAILFTIVVFKLVPNLIARIIIGAVIVLAMTWVGLLPAAEVTEEGGVQAWGPKSTT